VFLKFGPAATAVKPAPQTAPEPERFSAVVPKDRLVACGPGAWWAVMAGDGVTLVYWVFEAPRCAELPMHRHPQSQCGYVLEGEMTLKYEDGSERTLRAGEYYSIAPGVLHGGSVRKRAVVLDVYAPGRPDYEERYLFSARANPGSARATRVSAAIR
jgi:quercetin dioxygenase-like cupin family protein